MSTLTNSNGVEADALADALLDRLFRRRHSSARLRKSLGQQLVKATIDTLASKCSIEVTGESEGAKFDASARRRDLSCVIGVSGAMNATIVLCYSRKIAIAATQTLSGKKSTSVDEAVVETLCEITSKICETAKDLFGHSDATLGLTTIVSGYDHYVALGADMNISAYTLHTSAGDLGLKLAVPIKDATNGR